MRSSWRVIESGFLSPEAIMAKDAALLAQLDPSGPSLLHFYEWNVPCLTYGYFIDLACHIDLEALQQQGVQTARRPTGGGIIFHLTDFAFSILIPASHPRLSLNTLENYAFINQKVAEAVVHFAVQFLRPQLLVQESLCLSKECHAFCMAKPTQYDLIIQGKKVGGAAQRRTKQGLLHQASLSLLFPPIELLYRVLNKKEEVLKAMKEQSYCLLPEQSTAQELQEARGRLRTCLKMISAY
jgi:lipoate-protein ligase A